MKIAFIHDWLSSYTGGEKVLNACLELYPDAPVYTLIHNPERFVGTEISRHRVYTSFIDRAPFGRKHYRRYLPFMPLAIEQFDLGEYDVIFSNSSAVAKGVITRSDQLHIGYTLTPVRYAWDLQFQYLSESGLDRGLKTAFARPLLHYIRTWDAVASMRVDDYWATCENIAARVRKTYRRDAKVVYPPVEVARFNPFQPRDDYYVTLSRLVPYKKIDLIVEACTRTRRKLVVIGEGPDADRIRKVAGPTVQLLGHQDDASVARHLEHCKAFIFAADEDFGIAPIEAQAAGAPVIAFGRGGVLETVIPGETGLFFPKQTVESLIEALEVFERGETPFDPQRSRANAERFSTDRFRTEVRRGIEASWQAHLQRSLRT